MSEGLAAASVGVGMGKMCVTIYCTVHGAVMGVPVFLVASVSMPIICVVGEPCGWSWVSGAFLA